MITPVHTVRNMGRPDRPMFDLRGQKSARAGCGSGFTGVAYGPSGYKTEGLNSDGYKPWVKFSADGATFSEELGPPPVPWGTSEVWFEKAATYGNIVVSRLG